VCNGFFVELDEFNSTIATLVEVMDGQATKIEKAKLKAIGQRNKVDSEEGNRKRRAEELRAQINEDLTDLERLRAEHDSLNAVELEQRGLIERLSNNA
jgi:intraflagellar transport protein 20